MKMFKPETYNRQTIHIGYWKNDEFPNNPVPCKSLELTKTTKYKALYLISLIENKVKKKRYKGHSRCRICRCNLGSGEYQYRDDNYDIVMPEGYAHYIEKHNVYPDIENLLLWVKLLK